MFAEANLLPISALQHLLFCERQCALIHLEGQWGENALTVEGSHLHHKAHETDGTESRGDVRITRGLPLRSLLLGLSGVADVVEFHRCAQSSGPEDRILVVKLAEDSGFWRPFPVEYKRGRPKRNQCDEVQLCAQALCLEEMLNVHIPDGALYYGQTKHRFDVRLGPELRATTKSAIKRLHALFASRVTPPALREPKCDNCSLKALCLPGLAAKAAAAGNYVDQLIAEASLPSAYKGEKP